MPYVQKAAVLVYISYSYIICSLNSPYRLSHRYPGMRFCEVAVIIIIIIIHLLLSLHHSRHLSRSRNLQLNFCSPYIQSFLTFNSIPTALGAEQSPPSRRFQLGAYPVLACTVLMHWRFGSLVVIATAVELPAGSILLPVPQGSGEGPMLSSALLD